MRKGEKNAKLLMKPVLPQLKADKTLTDITRSFSLEAPSSKSSDVSTYPGVTAETRKVKRGLCCARGRE